MLNDLIAAIERNIIQVDPVMFWMGWGIVAVVFLRTIYRTSRGFNQLQLIANTPTAKIRSAVQGYIELNGQARLMTGPVIVSPLSKKNCVWYRYKIEEKSEGQQGNSRETTYWRVIKQETSGELFLLEDDTGRCVIDPDDADVIVTNKRTWYDKTSDGLPRRYTEELITENEPLYAIGLFKTIGNIERQKFKEQVSHLLGYWKRDPKKLLADYDVDRNGELSLEEWSRVQLAAEQQVRREQGAQEKQEQLNVLKQSEHADQIFILSTVSEQKLLKHYKWRTMRYLLGFFMCGCLLVWTINIRLDLLNV